MAKKKTEKAETTKKTKTVTTVHTELARIQQALHVPKNMYNSFGKYKYRNFESICEAVKPLLGDCTLTATDSIKLIGDRFYVEAEVTLTLTLLGSGGLTDNSQSITITGLARESESKKGMDSSQITGTASSYARKYAANGLFLIDDTKDADTDEFAKESKGSSKKAPAKKPVKKVAETTPPVEAPQSPGIEPEDSVATRVDILAKIQGAKAVAHLTNIYNKYSSQAQDEGWKDELIAECARIKAVLQLGVGE